MSRIELAPALAEDFERVLVHLAQYEITDGDSRIRDIMAAIGMLERNPLIGRPAGDNRELIIGKDARGYVALYRYIDALDIVFVLALRHQREAGYVRL
ncbi:type II toxin-antitoxin system RelE/ParE family toxin [Nevskia sp.]|uniref:type II toxin-antitoxin system RelE/ParE family toxin n=1 Tax=Nevskia sp. TaxID=1929292 RepID=UPI0025EDEB62|nr:type II toxin-antitoxin system RelE/ParE family toxin [Nevskia sp.]